MKTPDQELAIALLDPAGEAALFDFMRNNLGEWRKFQSCWRWRQQGLPHSGGETAVVAKYGGSIVGCVGIVPVRIFYAGEEIKTSWQQDSFVSSAMRGKGVAKKLVNKGAEAWEMVMAKGTSKPMYGLRKALAFADVPNDSYMLGINRPRKTAKSLKEAVAEYLLLFWKHLLPPPAAKRAVKVVAVDAFDRSFDTLADQLVRQPIVQPYKGSDYLNWRYGSAPEKRYTIFRAGGEPARGAIVVNISGDHADEGWIVDLICAPDDAQCAYALLRKAMAFFREQDVSRIWVFATLPVARQWLFRFGLLPTKRTPHFTYRIYGKSPAGQRLANADWSFWHGDGDVEMYQ